MAIPPAIHLLKRLKYLALFVLPLGVNVFLQEEHLYLTKKDFEQPHLVDLPPQKGQEKDLFF